MKNWFRKITVAAAAGIMILSLGTTAQAQEEGTIKPGIYADTIDLSGMDESSASQAIQAYVDSLAAVEITLVAANDQQVVTSAGEMGITWGNPEVVQEALEIGIHGNVIERYKVLKDLEHENQIYPIELSFNIESINKILSEKCTKYDQKAVNVSLKRENGSFKVIEGQTGYMLDVEASIDVVNDFLITQWNHEPVSIPLNVAVEEPKGSAQELSEVKDVLGSFSTYFNSGASRTGNIVNGCRLIDGVTLYPGEEFSMYNEVAPFTEKNGYYMAGSYLNGKVVDSLGGGICQVSTTLYNTVLQAELDVAERHNHSMIVNYVDPSADAAIAESSGKDFRFVNNKDYPVYLEAYVSNKRVNINIYGKETRSADRKVTYVSEVLETINPPADTIYPDGSKPIGYIVTESAHIGYKAKLWKVVTENGKEVSRTQVNSSSYKMVPRSATVGTATADPNALNEINAAIGTANIDHIKNVIALLTAQPPAPDQPSPEVPAE